MIAAQNHLLRRLAFQHPDSAHGMSERRHGMYQPRTLIASFCMESRMLQDTFIARKAHSVIRQPRPLSLVDAG
jgi:hypothetical protein